MPEVTAAGVERLLKAPDRYAVKRAAILGLRASVFHELRESLVSPTPRQGRNDTTLAVVRPLLAHLHALPDYTRRTATLSERTTAVRDALASATEPDQLLFSALPQACDVGPLAPNAAAELKRQQIGERMRTSAKEMRDGRGQAANAPTANSRSHARSRAQSDASAAARAPTRGGCRSSWTRAGQSASGSNRLEAQIRQAEAQGQSDPPAPGAGKGIASAGGRGGNGRAGSEASLQQLREEYPVSWPAPARRWAS